MFLKPTTAVIGPADAVRLPVESRQVEHEGELAVVIGPQGASEVPRERALDTVFGYTVANDVTARDLQRSDGQWTRAKGYNSFCPLGPWIETVLDPADLAIRTEVDGEVRQDSRTSLMIHDIATLVSYVSHVMTLLPGDVILTGTPAGVGPLRAGETVSVTVEGIGTLTNPVVPDERGDGATRRPDACGSASPRRRPATCTSATCAARCSTGPSPGTTAARTCCASRTPTAPAAPRSRTAGCSTSCTGSGSTGTRDPRSAARTRRTGSRSGWSSTPTWRASCTRPATRTRATAPTPRCAPGGRRAATRRPGTTTTTGP